MTANACAAPPAIGWRPGWWANGGCGSVRWVRPSYCTWPSRISIGAAGDKGRVVTNTQAADDNRLALSYAEVFQQVILKEGGTSRTWWNDVKDEATRLEQQIEEGAFNPMAADPLSDWQTEHERHFQKTRAAAGDTGLALRSYEAQGRRLRPEIEHRLRRRSCIACASWAYPAACNCSRSTASSPRSSSAKPTPWRARRRGAGTVEAASERGPPTAPVRPAGGHLGVDGAVYQVRRYLADSYHHRAVAEIRRCLQVVQRRVPWTARKDPTPTFCAASVCCSRANPAMAS